LPVGTLNDTRRSQRHGGGHVIGHLRDDAGPVDGVDTRQADAVTERVVVEHAFDQRLAVVERAADGERVNVLLARRRHHAALHVGDASLGIEDHDIDALGAAKGLDGGAARVARRRADDGRALASLGEHMIHQPREQLHRHVLKCQRRTVKQLQHERAGIDLHQGRDRRVAEAGVGLVGQPAQLVPGHGIADKGMDDRGRNLRKRASGKSGEVMLREAGPCLGHIEAAVAGQTGEQHVLEAEPRRLAACRYVVHGAPFAVVGGSSRQTRRVGRPPQAAVPPSRATGPAIPKFLPAQSVRAWRPDQRERTKAA
jgi:hypothetical protein